MKFYNRTKVIAAILAKYKIETRLFTLDDM